MTGLPPRRLPILAGAMKRLSGEADPIVQPPARTAIHTIPIEDITATTIQRIGGRRLAVIEASLSKRPVV